MNNVKNNIRKNFTICPNQLINDNSLSDRARFLFVYMSSKSDDWLFYQNATAKALGMSVPTLRKYLEELINAGWLTRERIRNKEGKYDSYDYTLHHEPSTKKTNMVKNQHGKKPTWENFALNNKYYNEIETISKKDYNNASSNFLTDANEVLLHLIEVTGQDWKPNNKRFITEAMKNGYSKQDLIEIIDLKQFQTEKINLAGRPAFDPKWMTPQTLFKNQVEKYYNEVQLIKQGKTKANPYETQQERQQQKRNKLQELGIDPFELFGFNRDADEDRTDV